MVRATQYRLFWYELSIWIKKNLPLLRAIIIIKIQSSERDGFDLGIKQVYEGTIETASFAEGMKRSGLFSQEEIEVVRGAEVSSMLEIALNQLANGEVPSRADQYLYLYKTLHSLMRNGTPILRALLQCAEKLDGPLQSAVMSMYEAVHVGDGMAMAMDKSGQFSALEVNLIDIGEETGSLVDALSQLARMSKPIKFE